MKPFNLEEAKAGKPVQTRDGRDVEIIKFDLRGDYPILSIVKYENVDSPETFTASGKTYLDENDDRDLVMKSEKKEGWVAVLKNGKLTFNMFDTKEEAETIGGTYPSFVAVAKIEWEE